MEDLKNQLAETRSSAMLRSLRNWKHASAPGNSTSEQRTLILKRHGKLDAERHKIQEEASKRADEQYQLKLAEKEKQIQDAKKANEELKRKLEQGSQQAQGEVLELQLEEMLRSAFPMDHIEPVPKGVNGADVIHKVLTRSGRLCGTIVWESKRTKAWSDGWLQKLKDDQRKLTAEIAVLVSEALPKDCEHIHSHERHLGSHAAVRDQFGAALRMQLLQSRAPEQLRRAQSRNRKSSTSMLWGAPNFGTELRR